MWAARLGGLYLSVKLALSENLRKQGIERRIENDSERTN